MKLKPNSLTDTRVVIVTVNKMRYAVMFDNIEDALDFDSEMLETLGTDSVLFFEPLTIQAFRLIINKMEKGN